MKLLKIKQQFIICLLIFISGSAMASVKLYSPNKAICLELLLNKNKSLVYTVSMNGNQLIQPSELGWVTNEADFSKGVKIIAKSKVSSETVSYQVPAEKRMQRSYTANMSSVTVKAKNGKQLIIDLKATDEGVAFRYRADNSNVITVKNELTAFQFAATTKAWLHPHAVVKTGWCETQPSYEEQYEYDIPVGTPSTLKQGWSFPALFKVGENWVLLTEAGLTPTYVGTHLAHNSDGGKYKIAFPQPGETLTLDEPNTASAGNMASAWRVIVCGSLNSIVTSQMVTDLAEPAIKNIDFSWVKPGIASWSWGVLHDESVNYETSKEFIEYAGKMGWEYCLIDADWDRKIGYDRMKELVALGNSVNVKLILWYNSSGLWNSTKYTPKNALLTQEQRSAEFKRIHEMGIAGVKVDFWPGDGQSAIKYYYEMMQDAAANKLLVNFHGATVPRGWSRTFPNLMSMESIRGFEFTTFDQKDTDLAPKHLTMMPYARNVVGPMDYTPVCFGEIIGKKRRTSNAFELALSVILQSGIQHYVEIPESMMKQPDCVVEFMRNVPRSWDDIKLLDGYPGKYVVMARKSAGKWYVAGINSQKSTQKVKVNLKELSLINDVRIITDGDTNRSFTQQSTDGVGEIEVEMQANGGFVIY